MHQNPLIFDEVTGKNKMAPFHDPRCSIRILQSFNAVSLTSGLSLRVLLKQMAFLKFLSSHVVSVGVFTRQRILQQVRISIFLQLCTNNNTTINSLNI